MAKTLYGISHGIKFNHLTLETIAVLRKCDRVYSNALDEATASNISRLTADLVLLPRANNAACVKTILQGFRTHDTIGFLTYGNPAFISSTIHALSVAAAKKNIRVKLLEAVSSIDSLLIHFNLTLESELRLLTVGNVADGAELTPETDTLFFCVGSLNASGHKKKRTQFLSKIASAYPPEKRVFLAAFFVNSDGHSVINGTIEELPTLMAKVSSQHTLFIPATKR
ncbi:MAG: hypothetical protein A2270_00715 [Elusimicrobia bacterium RIFOXYA12_FULL_51_18]|nr:MAG: hypothetical protein A2270_00715 [Elusimicrobia bacterium RIFOXYA12_FULL_51_18]OGS29020.1 MAG: hypothetical protein A2218_08730 [Elusimicrobia bacterium RIFOXYA2_FULL_53_38]